MNKVNEFIILLMHLFMNKGSVVMNKTGVI